MDHHGGTGASALSTIGWRRVAMTIGEKRLRGMTYVQRMAAMTAAKIYGRYIGMLASSQHALFFVCGVGDDGGGRRRKIW